MLLLTALFALQPAPVDLDWRAPEECPSASDFLARVEAQHAGEGDVTPIQVEALISSTPDERWVIVLELAGDGTSDRRTLAGESCEAVVEAAALIVALRRVEALSEPGSPAESGPKPEPPIQDTEEADEPPSSRRAPAEQRIPLAVPSPSVSAEEPGQRRARTPLTGWIGIGGGVAAGVLPGLGGAVALEGGVAGRLWRVGAFGRGYPLRTADHPRSTQVTGRFDLVTGGVVGCGLPSIARWSFPVCGRVELGGLRGHGERSVADPRAQWATWVGGGLSLAALWRIRPRIGPFVSAEGVAGINRPGFTVGTQPGPLFQAGRFGVRAWAGVEFFFGLLHKKGGVAALSPDRIRR